MSKPKTQRKPTITKHVSQNQNQEAQKTEKQPSWVVRGLLACRNVQIQQNQPQQKEAKSPPEAKENRKKQEHRKLQDPRCRIRCPDIWPDNTGHINLLYL